MLKLAMYSPCSLGSDLTSTLGISSTGIIFSPSNDDVWAGRLAPLVPLSAPGPRPARVLPGLLQRAASTTPAWGLPPNPPHSQAHGSAGSRSTASLPAWTLVRMCGRSTPGPQALQPRTISLGIGQIAADKAAEQPTSETVSSRECPLMTLVNCT